ncbi:MAG TPA: AzlD domain-containing protein [Rhodoplanes sp.]|nr:AzlD domain-containing protein [Rhodoplanes sp.]
MTLSELAPYLVLIFEGFLPHEAWRWLGVVLSRGLDEGSELIVWVREVAIAILTGVVGKIVVFSPGALAGVSLWVRLSAAVFGMRILPRPSAGAGRRCGGNRLPRAGQSRVWPLSWRNCGLERSRAAGRQEINVCNTP